MVANNDGRGSGSKVRAEGETYSKEVEGRARDCRPGVDWQSVWTRRLDYRPGTRRAARRPGWSNPYRGLKTVWRHRYCTTSHDEGWILVRARRSDGERLQGSRWRGEYRHPLLDSPGGASMSPEGQTRRCARTAGHDDGMLVLRLDVQQELSVVHLVVPAAAMQECGRTKRLRRPGARSVGPVQPAALARQV